MNLPQVPQLPHHSSDFISSPKKLSPKGTGDESVWNKLYSYNDREASFFKTLDENIKMFDNESKTGSGSDINQGAAEMSSEKRVCEEECREYITPLMNRTQGSITALLATKDSLDQLDSLHRIIQQLLTVQEQNYQMRKRLRTVKQLHVLKEMEIRVSPNRINKIIPPRGSFS